MKILKIEFRNINSLKDTHQVNFTEPPFITGSLFAITGPTGSGKSTILDVISLALFNQVPRLGKISKKEILEKGAILTRNQKEAFARVTYECKSGVYTSEWNISTARTGSLRDYEMQISKEPSGELLDLKKSDVPGKNEQLIGLNYNQFIKSVLLAQGEFSRFLQAKKDERGELLEKITGTGIYRQLGRRTFEKFREVNQYIQKQQDAVAVIQQELLEEEQLLEYTAQLLKKEKTCESLEKEIVSLGKNMELKKTIEEQLREMDKLVSEKDSAEKGLKDFLEEYGNNLTQHEKVRDVAEDLRSWKRLALDCADLDKELSAKNNFLKENSEEIQNCLKEISGFTKLEINQENVESELEKFAKKIRQLDKEVNEKVTEFKRLENVFNVETRELPCALRTEDPEATGKELKELKISSTQKIQKLKDNLKDIDLSNPDAEKFRLKKYLVEAREAGELSEKIKRISIEIQKHKNEEETLLPKIKELPVEIRHNEDNVKIVQEKLKNIRAEQRIKQLETNLKEHRALLTKGEPCPLCGAIHHPYAENLPVQNDELDKKLQTAEKELTAWSTKLTENTTTLKHYENSLKQLVSQRENLEKEHQEKQKEFLQKFDHLKFDEYTNWKQLCDKSQQQLENLEQFEKENRKLQCVETGLPLIKEMVKISAEGKELRTNLKKIYTGKDIHSDTQNFHTRWTELRQLEKAVRKQLEELQEKISPSKKNLENLETKLKEIVTEKGFEDIPQAGDVLLPDPEYFRLQNSRDKLQREIEKIGNSLKIHSSQVEKLKKDDVKFSAEELLKQQQEKQGNLKLVKDECEEFRRVIRNHNEDLQKLQQLKSEIAEKEKENKRWFLLNQLIGDSQGKKFNDFAQDLTLSQLLQLANIRLKDLSDRYRIDKPTEEEDDGLVAVDDHMGAQRRSVKTLSGGETFILSLSMALALSDLASRNVEINSLFIDEGFGTLDLETLDQTLDTLEKLQAESSKTIGIISHVDSLKERIATQIQLKRHGQGYSTLEVSG